MAYIPRSSLIPNEASGAIPVQMKRRRTIHVFGLIATLIFIVSLLGAVGVFLYNDFLGKQLETAKQGLGDVSNKSNQEKIEEIQMYDDRLRAAESLLKNHIAPSRLFEEIEDSTKETVQFQSLDFVYDPGFEATLTLGGNTKEFTSVALQKRQIFKDVLFSEFVLQDITTAKGVSTEAEEEAVPSESVAFTVTGIFRKGVLEYTGQSESTDAVSEDQEAVDSAPTPTNPEAVQNAEEEPAESQVTP